MKKILTILENILSFVLRSIVQIFQSIGRIVSVILFFLIVGGAVYYYMKPDLPPNELRELSKEFMPTQMGQIEATNIGKKTLDFMEVYEIPERAISKTGSIIVGTGGVLTGADALTGITN